MKIEIEPIGYVKAPRPHAEDDFWGGEQARIELAPGFAAEAVQGLGAFSHIVRTGRTASAALFAN